MNRCGVSPVDILVSQTRNQKTRYRRDDNVFGKQRAPFKSGAAIEREIVARVVGEKHQLSRVRADRPDVIYVYKALKFRCDVGIQAVTDNEGPGIDEVGLAFGFAGAEVDHQAVALFKIDRGAAQIEALMRVKAERSADKKRPVQNR